MKLLLLLYETAYVYFWIIVNSILIVKFHIYILNIDYMLYKICCTLSVCVWVYSTYINNVDDKQKLYVEFVKIKLLMYCYIPKTFNLKIF